MEKQKLANYYKDLPQGFKEDYRIDAKKTSVGVVLNVIAGAIALALIVALYLAKYGLNSHQFYNEDPVILLIAAAVFCVSMILYLVVHELTHGAAYKLLTRQKLRFGMTLTVAYCGLKEGYVNKKTSLIATLAPFVLHSIWMIIAYCLLPDNVWALVIIMLFSLHFGGCIGDLWVTGILLFKYRKKQVLVSDDGPGQVFYAYSDEVEEQAPVAEQTPQAEEE